MKTVLIKLRSDSAGIISIAVLLLLNIILINLPLSNSLGFEFAAVNGILLFILGGISVVSANKKSALNSFISLINSKNYLFAAFTLIPFLIGLTSSVLLSKCPFGDGILFYLIIAVPSLFFGAAAGFFSSILSPKFPLSVFLFFFLILLFIPLAEFFINPQIYFYNPLFGFYPGTIYDEDLSPDRILVSYRIFNAAFFVSLIYLSERMAGKKLKIRISASLILLAAIIVAVSVKPFLNFSTDKNKLERILYKKIDTGSFSIHLPENIDSKEAEYIALLHEYYLDQIRIVLGNDYSEKIDSYIFKDKGQKRILLGSGNADIAKPWLSQIYMNYPNYAMTLKHELIHIVMGKFGTTLLKVADGINPALIEGFAMAFENNYNGYPVHYMAKMADCAGYKFPVQQLFKRMNFLSKTSSISYIYSGSFIKYLADNYGLERVKKIYGRADYEKIFGKNLTALALEYDKFLSVYPIEFNRYEAQLYFGSKTIFKKFCPRMAAADAKKAALLYSGGRVEESLRMFKEIYSYSGSAQSLRGIISCLWKLKRFVEARKLLGEEMPNFASDSYLFNLKLLYGDLSVKTGNRESALAIYDTLFSQNPEIDYSNEVLLRKEIMKEGIDSLSAYFDESETMRYSKLLELNRRGLKYFSLPALFQLAERLKIDSKFLSDFLNSRMDSSKAGSRYSAMLLSRYALKNGNYTLAKSLAVLSVDLSDNELFKKEATENLRMTNWFVNNADELRKSFRTQ